jgi:hypothetical protein
VLVLQSALLCFGRLIICLVDNTPPKVGAKFYKAVVQSVLLYGSETWNLTTTALTRLEGFHIRAA